MREIKFRGKNSAGWVIGSLIVNPVYTAILEIEDPDEGTSVRHYVIPDTVGQFTGLRDENGREIYDGDIIDVDGEFIAEVVYCDGAYELYTKQGPLGKLSDIAYEYSLAILDGVIETFSVIGNIHDNPDLLEKRP